MTSPGGTEPRPDGEPSGVPPNGTPPSSETTLPDMSAAERAPRGHLSRRSLIAAGVVLGAGVVGAAVGFNGRPASHSSGQAPPATGTKAGSTPPTATPTLVPGGALVVKHHVLLDHSVAVSELHIEPTGILEFASDRDITLECIGNAMVLGTLRMKPANASISHVLRFPKIDEKSYVGGMPMVVGDIGMWVMGGGGLELSGAPRTAWVRASGSVSSGSTTLDLATAPTGWLPGDELVITPTEPVSERQNYDSYDYGVVQSVRGNRVTLRAPLKHNHPVVSPGRGLRLTAEVLNLTRNVRIEGTPTGRAHVWILSSTPQKLSQVAIRYMGPRQGSTGVLSRYPLHFHTCGDGSRGSAVSNVVVRDCGNHAFVAHASHGVTFTGCISHNTIDDAYWWDQAPDTHTTGPATDDAAYVACVASRVLGPPGGRGYRLAGFNLSTGTGDSIHDCVAVGVQGDKDAAGFVWPEGGTGVWDFANNIAHNNKQDGIFTWQNNTRDHVVDRFLGYYNGAAGISHGAYNNAYHYNNLVLYGNGRAGLLLHAVSSEQPTQRFDNMLIDGLGKSLYAVEVVKHTLPTTSPTQLVNCQLQGYSRAGIGFTYDGQNGPTTPERYDIIDCSFSGNMFWLSSTLDPGSEIRVQNASGSALLVTPPAHGGSINTDWNASVSPIAPFAPTSDAAVTPIRVLAASPKV